MTPRKMACGLKITWHNLAPLVQPLCPPPPHVHAVLQFALSNANFPNCVLQVLWGQRIWCICVALALQYSIQTALLYGAWQRLEWVVRESKRVGVQMKTEHASSSRELQTDVGAKGTSRWNMGEIQTQETDTGTRNGHF